MACMRTRAGWLPGRVAGRAAVAVWEVLARAQVVQRVPHYENVKRSLLTVKSEEGGVVQKTSTHSVQIIKGFLDFLAAPTRCERRPHHVGEVGLQVVARAKRVHKFCAVCSTVIGVPRAVPAASWTVHPILLSLSLSRCCEVGLDNDRVGDVLAECAMDAPVARRTRLVAHK